MTNIMIQGCIYFVICKINAFNLDEAYILRLKEELTLYQTTKFKTGPN